MDGAAGILVILLSIVLIIFLILLSFLVVLLIRISRQIKHIADDTERTITKANSLMMSVGRFTKPALAGRMVLGLLNKRRKGESNVKRK
ncbi:MAG: hypothetical protein ACTJG2_01870 [Candidatus Saccharimonadales bacterium]